jgi:DNA-binding CsgD family transcriptional regulator
MMNPFNFSAREWDVVRGVMAGQTNKEIAHGLGLAIGTVSRLRDNAVKKAGARNSPHLVALVLGARK